MASIFMTRYNWMMIAADMF